MTKYEQKMKQIHPYLQSVDGEWTCDGERFEIAVVVSTDMLNDPKYGFNVDKNNLNPVTKDIRDYVHTDLGTFWCDEGKTWFWACPTRAITENSKKRSTYGIFQLLDSETGEEMPNTKPFKEFKKVIKPLLDAEMKQALSEL